MCPNRIKSGLDMKGSGSGGGGVRLAGTSIFKT